MDDAKAEDVVPLAAMQPRDVFSMAWAKQNEVLRSRIDAAEAELRELRALLGESRPRDSDRPFIQAIKPKVHHCIPLTSQEVDELWRIATGDRIERRKRCDACHGTGESMIWAGACEYCGGDGYLRSNVHG
jgi:hypothetical protein